MRLRRKLAIGLATLVVAVPLTVASTATADVSPQSCEGSRSVSVSNPTGGAHISGLLCWTPLGNGWYDLDWSLSVDDTEGDSAGAAVQVKYTTVWGVDSRAYRVDGADSRPLTFTSGYSTGTGLYARACLINGDSVHDCSAWK